MILTGRLLGAITASLVACAASVMSPSAEAQEADPPTVLITGSNRGIGLEFTRQYAEAGWIVIATSRKPDKAADLQALATKHPLIVMEELDITDPVEITALAAKYAGEPIDLLLNNAAYLGTSSGQEFTDVDYEMAEQMFSVNSLGALRMTEAFVDHVSRSNAKKIVAITSLSGSTGSIENTKLISYRASKAALNSIMRNLSFALAHRGISVGMINPGVVDSAGYLDLKDDEIPSNIRPIIEAVRNGTVKMHRPPESVAAMRIVIENLSLESSGGFFDYDGSILPW